MATRFRFLILLLLTFSGTAYSQIWENITTNTGADALRAGRGVIVSDGVRLYAIGGPSGRGVLVSEDNGETFTPINTVSGAGYTLADGNLIHSLRFANGRLWVSGSSGDSAFNYLHWLAPGSTVWQQGATDGFPPPAELGGFGTISDIVYDSHSARYFVIAEIGGVWSSADGQTWEPRTDGFGGIGAPASLAEVNGTLFALRPLSGLRRSTDAGLSWHANSPHTGVDGAQLERVGDGVSFLVPGPSATSIAYHSPDTGETWITVPNLPRNLGGNLSGDGQLLFAPSGDERLLFSATSGLTWQDLPTDGLKLEAPVWPDTDYVGVFEPSRIERHGDYLFLIGNEIIDNSFTKVAKLYRIHLTGFDWRAETVILEQPRSRGNFAGGNVTLDVFAAGHDLTYQWFKDEIPVPGANGSSLTLSEVTADDAGEYHVVVTGARGMETSQTVTVEVRAERIDGQFDLTYEPEVTNGAGLHLLADGTILRVRTSVPSFIARMNLEGRELNQRGLSAGLPTGEQFVPQFHFIDEAGRLIVAGYTSGSNTASNQRLRRFDPVTLEDDPTFPILGGFDGQINGLVELPGRGYLVSGNFNSIGGTPVARVALIHYDGTVDADYAVGLAKSPHSMIAGADGTVYIQGDFGGTPYLRLLRLDRRGRIMTDFPPFTDMVEFMHRLNEGRILLVTTWNGNRTVQVLRPDGTPDPLYTSSGTFNEEIHAVTEQPDGKLILTGEFTQFGGQPVAGHIRLLPSGERDSTYDDSASFSGNIFFSLRIASALYTPGYVFLSNSGDASFFQGYPNLGSGPVRVLAQQTDLAILRQSLSRLDTPGSDVTLTVQAHGSTAVHYQWLHNGVEIPGATGPALVLTDLDATHTGTYTVRVSNESGSIVSQSIDLSLVDAPEFLTTPESADLLTGENHTFSVEVEGASPFTYQWFFNGEPIAGANGASLTLTDVQREQAGHYTVVVSNNFGSIESPSGSITVNTVTGQRITTFVTSPSNNSQVNQVLQRPDGVLVARGTFSSIGGGSAQRFALLDPDTGAQIPEINRGGFNHNVNGIAIQSDGKVIVAGQFTSALGSNYNRLVRLNLDGTVDETFNANGAGPSNPPLGVWTLRDGRILINSSGGTYNGTSVSSLYRLLPDGTLDPSWNSGGPSSANNIYAITEQPDGRLVIGGAFSTFGGVINQHLVRLLPDGALDTEFNDSRPTVNYYVHAVAVQPDGRILLAGEFNNVGTANPPYRKLARLHADGSLDTSFTAAAVNTGYQVRAMQLLLNGKILLGGTFQNWPGAHGSHAGTRLVLLNPDGTVDPFFRPGTTNSTNSTVDTLLALPEGKAYVGGQFTALAGTGPGANRLGAITIDSADLAITRQPASVVADLGGTATFDVGVHTTSDAAYQWYKDGQPIAGATAGTLALTDLTREDAGDYTVVVTNETDQAVSSAATLTVLAEPAILTQPTSVTADPGGSVTFSVEAIGRGTLTYEWRHNGVVLEGETAPVLTVSDAQAADAGFYEVVVTNDLGSVPSDTVALSISARVGAPDPGFAVNGSGPNSSIFAIAPLSNGRLALGGAFSSFSDAERYRFALLEADGSLVNLATNPVLTGGATSIIEQPDDKLFLGWAFGFMRINSDGSQDTSFAPTGRGMQVETMDADDSYIYVAGYTNASLPSMRRFDIVTGAEDGGYGANAGAAGFLGVRTQAFLLRADGSIIAFNQNGTGRRLHSDGTADAAFNAPAIPNVRAIWETPDGKLWLAGGFTTVGGQPRPVLVRLHSDGSLDGTFVDSGFTSGGTGRALLQVGSYLYLAGDFTYTSGDQIWRSLVRFSIDSGEPDETFGPVLDVNAGFALALDAQNRLLLGGSFTDPVNRLLRVITSYEGDFAIVGQPRSQTVASGNRAHFSVAWIGGGGGAYQWYCNDVAIEGATAQDLFIPAVDPEHAGNYTVSVTVGSETLTSAAATLTVAEDGGDPDPLTFENWSALASLPADQRGPLDNPAGDGLPNLLKFVLGLDPAIPFGSPVHVPDTLITVAGEEFPLMTFTRRKEIGIIILEVEVSSGLDFGDELGSEIVDVIDNGDGTETLTVRSATPASVHERQFMRLRATML